MKARGKRNILRERQEVVEIPDILLACSRGGRPFQVSGRHSNSMPLWDMVVPWLRRWLSTGGSWVRLPL